MFLFAFGGEFVLVASLAGLLDLHDLSNHQGVAYGAVTAVHKHRNHGQVSYRTKVHFVPGAGGDVAVTLSFDDRHHGGDQVRVFYDARDPHRARPVSAESLVRDCRLPLLVGVGMLVLAVLELVVAPWPSRQWRRWYGYGQGRRRTTTRG